MIIFFLNPTESKVTEKTSLKHKERWDKGTSSPVERGIDKDYIHAGKKNPTTILTYC